MDNTGKKSRGKTGYLSYRLLIWILLFFSALLVIYILYLVRPDILYDYIGARILIGLLLAGFFIFFNLWIVRPYYKKEYRLKRILEGYLTLEDPETEEGIALTPVVDDAEKAVYKLLNSTQVVNLNKRQAQYLALQNQINPHFLYNTLDGIRSEALIAGLDNVAEMTEALAVFFRYTISKVENLVTIEDELDNCRTYFMIQQYRFGERISLRIEMDEPDLGSYLIPKLTLQPILENSIIHGTEMKIGNGTTVIRVCRTDSRILIEIKDDGVGMDEDVLERLNRRLDSGVGEFQNMNNPPGGIALNNVNNRIRLLFGQEYGIQVFSIKDIGTTVEISIPATTQTPEMENGGRHDQ